MTSKQEARKPGASDEKPLSVLIREWADEQSIDMGLGTSTEMEIWAQKAEALESSSNTTLEAVREKIQSEIDGLQPLAKRGNSVALGEIHGLRFALKALDSAATKKEEEATKKCSCPPDCACHWCYPT